MEFYNNLAEPGIRLDNKYRINPAYVPKFRAGHVLPVNPSAAARLIKGGVTTLKTAARISEALSIPLGSLFVFENKRERLSDNAMEVCVNQANFVISLP
jgi:hypothetical protein